MKTVKLGNTEIRIKPQSFAAMVKAEQILKEAGLDKHLTGEDIIQALKKDSDILHKLAAVYYLNDPVSLKRWSSVWREWADKFAPLQMIPIIEAGVNATREGVSRETLNRAAVLEALIASIEAERKTS